MIKALFIGGPLDRTVIAMPNIMKTFQAQDIKGGAVCQVSYEVEFANLAGDQVIYFVKDYDARDLVDRLHQALTEVRP